MVSWGVEVGGLLALDALMVSVREEYKGNRQTTSINYLRKACS